VAALKLKTWMAHKFIYRRHCQVLHNIKRIKSFVKACPKDSFGDVTFVLLVTAVRMVIFRF
jgi:hypothetical protein